MSHIFISYSRKDSDFVYPFIENLERFYQVYVDKEMRGTLDFPAELEQKVKSATAFLIFLSPDAVDSKWVKNELATAQNADIPIIPYLYRECVVPMSLQITNWIKHSIGEKAAFEAVLDALSVHASVARHHSGHAIDFNLLRSGRKTFGAVAAEYSNALQSIYITVRDKRIELIGLPLLFSRYHAAYLVGRSDDQVGSQNTMQLAFQLTQSYPGNDFLAEIASQLLESEGTEFPLRMLLIRGPLTHDPREEPKKKKPHEYGYGYQTLHAEEWADAVDTANFVLEQPYSVRPKNLQIFIKGPSIFLYKLGADHKGFYNVELYHYDRNAAPPKQYFRVL